jgi:hypothetical protein
MGLARGQQEGEWIAEGVDQGMNPSAQPSIAAPDCGSFSGSRRYVGGRA